MAGLDQKVDEVIGEINTPAVEPRVVFNPDKENMFEITEPQSGVEVDREKLFEKIDEEFAKSSKIVVEIPTNEVAPEKTVEEVQANLAQRSKFSTSYKSSIKDRKSNIKLALSKFNGMVVEPDQEVSFNQNDGSKNRGEWF